MRRLLFGVVAPLIAVAVGAAPVAAAKPAVEPMYSNGTTVYMAAPPSTGMPAAHVPDDLYLAVYPINPNGSTNLGPKTVGTNNYAPQCNPCFHPGVPLPFSYHDHIISGSPGFGNNGTAGSFNPWWHVFVVMYNPADFTNKAFTPVMSNADLDRGEQNGLFLPINKGGANPYEVDTGIVFLCVIVSSHA